MQDSIFTKIINGAVPCHEIYEDDSTFAFLDIDPLLPGHVLVVPKNQVDHVDDLPDADYQALMATVKKLALHIRSVLGTARTAQLIMGYDVPHAHVHLLPSDNGHTLFAAFADRADTTRQAPSPDHAALALMAQQLIYK